MKKFNIISKYEETSRLLANRIKNELLENSFIYDEISPDLIIILGGDGKLLRTVHHYLDKIANIDFVTLTTGTLGYASDFAQSEIEDFIKCLISDEYEIEKIHLLEANINYQKRTEIVYGLNEIRLENRNYTSIIDVYINNNFFENFRGNGLCISTPFGSTGYNKSLAGSILLNEVQAIQLTEIAGIHNTSYHSLGNSLLVPKNATITLKPISKYPLIGLDHQLLDSKELVSIDVKFSEKHINFAHYKPKSSIDRIKKSFIFQNKK